MQAKTTQKVFDTRRLTVNAMFAAIATLLMYVEFPLPFLPPFLKIDLSGVVVLLAAFLFGPVPAVLITLVKNLVHLMSSSSGGVGQLADFIILSSFVVTAALIYRRKKDKKHALIGCCAAIVVITIVGALANKYLLIPFYSQLMPIDVIISLCAKVNPIIVDLNSYYIFGAAPFNFIKGVILSVITILCYKKLFPWH